MRSRTDSSFGGDLLEPLLLLRRRRLLLLLQLPLFPLLPPFVPPPPVSPVIMSPGFMAEGEQSGVEQGIMSSHFLMRESGGKAILWFTRFRYPWVRSWSKRLEDSGRMTGSSSHVAEGRDRGSESSMLLGWKAWLWCGVRSPGNRSPAGCDDDDDEEDGTGIVDEDEGEADVFAVVPPAEPEAAADPEEDGMRRRLIRLPLDPGKKEDGSQDRRPSDDSKGSVPAADAELPPPRIGVPLFAWNSELRCVPADMIEGLENNPPPPPIIPIRFSSSWNRSLTPPAADGVAELRTL